jgi:hypothetical protein
MEDRVNKTKSLRDLLPSLKEMTVSRGYNPPPMHRMRTVIVGRSGVGKTHLLSSIPDAVYLDTEGAANLVPNPTTEAIRITSFKELQDVANDILRLAQKPDCPIKTVVVDSLDKLQALYQDHLEKVVWGKTIQDYRGGKDGYRDLYDFLLYEFLGGFDRAGLGWVSSTHLVEKTEITGGQSSPRERFGVYPGVQTELVKDADFILEMQVIKSFGVNAGKEERQIHTKQVGPYKVPKKVRVPLPEKIGPIPRDNGWQMLADAVSASVEKERESLQAKSS